jgi:hypothetical protein
MLAPGATAPSSLGEQDPSPGGQRNRWQEPEGARGSLVEADIVMRRSKIRRIPYLNQCRRRCGNSYLYV